MEQFFRDLGDLKAKFLSLEYWLRTFLFRHEGHPFMRDLDTLKVGDPVDPNPFTNGDALDKLVTKYNDIIRKKNPALVIDPVIIKIRDALAHGRIYRKNLESHPRLLKFSRWPDKAGKYRAETVETLDATTLGFWNARLFMVLAQVDAAL